MKETKKVTSQNANLLTKEQGFTLKTVGRLRVGDVKNFAKYIPTDPTKPMWTWVFNKGNGTLVLGDLGMNIATKEIVYLPKFFSTDKINSSIGIRNAIFIFKSLIPIQDPSELTDEDIAPTPPLIETLPKGEHDADSVIKTPNPLIEGLIDYEEKEKAAQEDLTSSVKVGEDRRRKPKKTKKTEAVEE